MSGGGRPKNQTNQLSTSVLLVHSLSALFLQDANERGWRYAVVTLPVSNAGRTSRKPRGTEGEEVGILRVHDWRGARESFRTAKALFAEE
jgi:hypothetical protein